MSYFWLGRKYQLCKSLHFDSYLEVLDVDPVLRKMENSLRSTVFITYNNGTGMFTMTTQNDYLSNSIMFKLGEKFNEVTCDRRKCESIVTLSGNTLIHVQKYPKVKAIILRQFCEYGMLAAFVVSGKKAFRMYIMENEIPTTTKPPIKEPPIKEEIPEPPEIVKEESRPPKITLPEEAEAIIEQPNLEKEPEKEEQIELEQNENVQNEKEENEILNFYPIARSATVAPR